MNTHPDKPSLAAFVGLHVAAVAVATTWFLTLAVSSFAFEGTRLLPDAAISALMLAACLLPVPVACWFVRRRIAQRQRPISLDTLYLDILWWCGLPIVLATAAFTISKSLLHDQRLDGPTSPHGLRVVIDVRDNPVFFTSWFHGDVQVLDGEGKVLARWRDRSGSMDRLDPRAMRDSMQWSSPTTLQFVDAGVAVQLRVP